MTEARVPVTDDALVEKVARAMCFEEEQDPDGPHPEDKAEGITDGFPMHVFYAGAARAAIAIAYPAGVATGREEVSAAIREVRLAEAAYAEGKSGAVDRLDAALKALFAYEVYAIRERGE